MCGSPASALELQFYLLPSVTATRIEAAGASDSDERQLAPDSLAHTPGIATSTLDSFLRKMKRIKT